MYLACLQLGGGYVSIIAKRAEVERTNCYYILKTLSTKGLIGTASKGSVRYYVPEPPKKLLSEAQVRLQLVERLVPVLSSLQNTAGGKAPKIRYYDDAESVRTLFLQGTKSSSEVLRYTNTRQLESKFGPLLRDYGKKLALRNVRTRIVSSYGKDSSAFLEKYFPKDYARTHAQLLYVNPREFLMENDVSIFDSTVSIISLQAAENFGIVIESQVYADTSRTIFNLAWLGASSFEVK